MKQLPIKYTLITNGFPRIIREVTVHPQKPFNLSNLPIACLQMYYFKVTPKSFSFIIRGFMDREIVQNKTFGMRRTMKSRIKKLEALIKEKFHMPYYKMGSKIIKNNKTIDLVAVCKIAIGPLEPNYIYASIDECVFELFDTHLPPIIIDEPARKFNFECYKQIEFCNFFLDGYLNIKRKGNKQEVKLASYPIIKVETNSNKKMLFLITERTDSPEDFLEVYGKPLTFVGTILLAEPWHIYNFIINIPEKYPPCYEQYTDCDIETIVKRPLLSLELYSSPKVSLSLLPDSEKMKNLFEEYSKIFNDILQTTLKDYSNTFEDDEDSYDPENDDDHNEYFQEIYL
jgi:hypothetical protein